MFFLLNSGEETNKIISHSNNDCINRVSNFLEFYYNNNYIKITIEDNILEQFCCLLEQTTVAFADYYFDSKDRNIHIKICGETISYRNINHRSIIFFMYGIQFSFTLNPIYFLALVKYLRRTIYRNLLK